jgi:hypothetical protein
LLANEAAALLEALRSEDRRVQVWAPGKQEQGKETAEQLNKLSDKIEHLKDEHNKYKIEITERFNSNHTHR